ncbi:MAG: Lipopolysaccharide assembly protein B [Chlamydiae bacterium]|nr:Lipopolysaccharide assembly protein B [Chlamydiota bacterium]
MLFFWLIFLSLAAPLSASTYPPLPEARSEEEGLWVGRIVDFWKDGEYSFAQTQIQEFLHIYPDSPFQDHFYVLLGDIAFKKTQIARAVDHYEKVSSSLLADHVKGRRWQGLYLLKQFTKLYEELVPIWQYGSEEERFYFAEASFRKEGAREEKNWEETLHVYETLLDSATRGGASKLATAEICHLLGQTEKSTSLLEELAQQEEDEEVLFRAAVMLREKSPESAQELFSKIAKEGGNRAEKSTLCLMKLLALGKKWEVLNEERSAFLSGLQDKNRSIAFYYLGISAFEQKNYHQAIGDLQKALDGKKGIPDKTVLFALLKSSQETKALSLCKEMHEKIKKTYPEMVPEASLILAKAYREEGETSKAIALLDMCLQNSSNHEISESAALQVVSLLVAQQEWGEAHKKAQEFLAAYPHSCKKKEMIRLEVDLSLSSAAEEETYSQLALDLEQALGSQVYSHEEWYSKQALLASVYLKLNRLYAASIVLSTLENPDPYLIAHYYIQEGNSKEQIISFGEHALVHSAHPEKERLHLHLFNTYLGLAKESGEEYYAIKAAKHLGQALETFPISLENRLFLAHHFVKMEDPQAIPLLESFFQTDESWIRFIEEAHLLSRLYLSLGKKEKAVRIGEKLLTIEKPLSQKTELLLADLYREMENWTVALPFYKKLEKSSDLSISYEAKFQLALYQFQEEPEKSLHILEGLKGQKVLALEPIHLKAGLEYANRKASLLPEEERAKELYTQLSELYKEFTEQNDLCSKEYHASRADLPDKDRIYQEYLLTIRTRLEELEGEIAQTPASKKWKILWWRRDG